MSYVNVRKFPKLNHFKMKPKHVIFRYIKKYPEFEKIYIHLT